MRTKRHRWSSIREKNWCTSSSESPSTTTMRRSCDTLAGVDHQSRPPHSSTASGSSKMRKARALGRDSKMLRLGRSGATLSVVCVVKVFILTGFIVSLYNQHQHHHRSGERRAPFLLQAEAGSKSSKSSSKTTVIAIDGGGGGGKAHPVPVPWPVVHCHHHHHHMKYVPKPVLIHHWIKKYKPFETAASEQQPFDAAPPPPPPVAYGPHHQQHEQQHHHHHHQQQAGEMEFQPSIALPDSNKFPNSLFEPHHQHQQHFIEPGNNQHKLISKLSSVFDSAPNADNANSLWPPLSSELPPRTSYGDNSLSLVAAAAAKLSSMADSPAPKRPAPAKSGHSSNHNKRLQMSAKSKKELDELTRVLIASSLSHSRAKSKNNKKLADVDSIDSLKHIAVANKTEQQQKQQAQLDDDASPSSSSSNSRGYPTTTTTPTTTMAPTGEQGVGVGKPSHPFEEPHDQIKDESSSEQQQVEQQLQRQHDNDVLLASQLDQANDREFDAASRIYEQFALEQANRMQALGGVDRLITSASSAQQLQQPLLMPGGAPGHSGAMLVQPGAIGAVVPRLSPLTHQHLAAAAASSAVSDAARQQQQQIRFNPSISARVASGISESHTIGMMTRLAEQMAQLEAKKLLMVASGQKKAANSKQKPQSNNTTTSTDNGNGNSALKRMNLLSALFSSPHRDRRRNSKPALVASSLRMVTMPMPRPMAQAVNSLQQQWPHLLLLDAASANRQATGDGQPTMGTFDVMNPGARLMQEAPQDLVAAASTQAAQASAAGGGDSRLMMMQQRQATAQSPPIVVSGSGDSLFAQASGQMNKISDPPGSRSPLEASSVKVTTISAARHSTQLSPAVLRPAAAKSRSDTQFFVGGRQQGAPQAPPVVARQQQPAPTKGASQVAQVRVAAGGELVPPSANGKLQSSPPPSPSTGAGSNASTMSAEQESRFYQGQREHLFRGQPQQQLGSLAPFSSMNATKFPRSTQLPFRMYNTQPSNVHNFVVYPPPAAAAQPHQAAGSKSSSAPEAHDGSSSMISSIGDNSLQSQMAFSSILPAAESLYNSFVGSPSGESVSAQSSPVVGGSPAEWAQVYEQQQQQQQQQQLQQPVDLQQNNMLAPMASYLEFPLSPEQWSAEALKSMNNGNGNEEGSSATATPSGAESVKGTTDQDRRTTGSGETTLDGQRELEMASGQQLEQAPDSLGSEQQPQQQQDPSADPSGGTKGFVFEHLGFTTQELPATSSTGQGGNALAQHSMAPSYHPFFSATPHFGHHLYGHQQQPHMAPMMGWSTWNSGGRPNVVFASGSNFEPSYAMMPPMMSPLMSATQMPVASASFGGPHTMMMPPTMMMGPSMGPFSPSVMDTGLGSMGLSQLSAAQGQPSAKTKRGLATGGTKASSGSAAASPKISAAFMNGIRGGGGANQNNQMTDNQWAASATSDMNQLRQLHSSLSHSTGHAGNNITTMTRLSGQLRDQMKNFQQRLPQMPNIPQPPQMPNLPQMPPGMMQMAGLALPFAMARATRNNNRNRDQQVNAAANNGGTTAGQRFISGAASLTNRLIRPRRKPTTSSSSSTSPPRFSPPLISAGGGSGSGSSTGSNPNSRRRFMSIMQTVIDMSRAPPRTGPSSSATIGAGGAKLKPKIDDQLVVDESQQQQQARLAAAAAAEAKSRLSRSLIWSAQPDGRHQHQPVAIATSAAASTNGHTMKQLPAISQTDGQPRLPSPILATLNDGSLGTFASMTSPIDMLARQLGHHHHHRSQQLRRHVADEAMEKFGGRLQPPTASQAPFATTMYQLIQREQQRQQQLHQRQVSGAEGAGPAAGAHPHAAAVRKSSNSGMHLISPAAAGGGSSGPLVANHINLLLVTAQNVTGDFVGRGQQSRQQLAAAAEQAQQPAMQHVSDASTSQESPQPTATSQEMDQPSAQFQFQWAAQEQQQQQQAQQQQEQHDNQQQPQALVQVEPSAEQPPSGDDNQLATAPGNDEMLLLRQQQQQQTEEQQQQSATQNNDGSAAAGAGEDGGQSQQPKAESTMFGGGADGEVQTAPTSTMYDESNTVDNIIGGFNGMKQVPSQEIEYISDYESGQMSTRLPVIPSSSTTTTSTTTTTTTTTRAPLTTTRTPTTTTTTMPITPTTMETLTHQHNHQPGTLAPKRRKVKSKRSTTRPSEAPALRAADLLPSVGPTSRMGSSAPPRRQQQQAAAAATTTPTTRRARAMTITTTTLQPAATVLPEVSGQFEATMAAAASSDDYVQAIKLVRGVAYPWPPPPTKSPRYDSIIGPVPTSDHQQQQLGPAQTMAPTMMGLTS